MEHADGSGTLNPGSDTLTHLDKDHRAGLAAAGVFALVSFVSTTTLFLFLTYKLLPWFHSRVPHEQQLHEDAVCPLGLASPDGAQNQAHATAPNPAAVQPSASSSTRPEPLPTSATPSPFPILIYNLLLSEMQTSLGYTLNLRWAALDSIYVGTTTCSAQGWLDNFGVMTSSLFFMSIALCTYLAVVHGWRPPRRALHVWIVGCWVLAVVLGIIGPITTRNGWAEGGWFVRANTWVSSCSWDPGSHHSASPLPS